MNNKKAGKKDLKDLLKNTADALFAHVPEDRRGKLKRYARALVELPLKHCAEHYEGATQLPTHLELVAILAGAARYVYEQEVYGNPEGLK